MTWCVEFSEGGEKGEYRKGGGGGDEDCDETPVLWNRKKSDSGGTHGMTLMPLFLAYATTSLMSSAV